MARIGAFDPHLTPRGWFGTHYSDPLNGFYDRTFVGVTVVGILAAYGSGDMTWVESAGVDESVQEYESLDDSVGEWIAIDGAWRTE